MPTPSVTIFQLPVKPAAASAAAAAVAAPIAGHGAGLVGLTQTWGWWPSTACLHASATPLGSVGQRAARVVPSAAELPKVTPPPVRTEATQPAYLLADGVAAFRSPRVALVAAWAGTTEATLRASTAASPSNDETTLIGRTTRTISLSPFACQRE